MRGSLGYRGCRREDSIAAQTTASIRRATPADADALALVGRDTFIETFGHLYPPEDLAGFLAQSHAPSLYAELAGGPDHALWIATADGRAVGYAMAGPCGLPHPEVTATCGELHRLYVRREAQGSGLGVRLLETTLDWLERPARRLWIGVWSENLGAQRLYARYGFEKVGEHEFQVGATRDQEFTLARPAPMPPVAR
jgi:ribosomal protein S18 acetylase RimI-like enzyme